MNAAETARAGRSADRKVLVFILAGGEGKRLMPLTRDRAKPAVPFGGRYRIIDVVLSNFVNSGMLKIVLLTQYKSDSLQRHIRRAWNLSPLVGHYVECVPAQMRTGTEWYKGSAHAVWQNLYILGDEKPDYVCVFGADHIYQMDVRRMLDHHVETGAECTIAAIPYPRAKAREFGVCGVDAGYRLTRFTEKSPDPDAMPGRPDWSLVSMGNYIFNADVLKDACEADAGDPNSAHDFGKNIIPRMLARGATSVYDFNRNVVPGETRTRELNYWRDVGSIDTYHEVSMDLVSVTPQFNLYNTDWPVAADGRNLPPAKFVFADEARDRVGRALDSLVAEGCIVSGGEVRNSILFPSARIHSYADVEQSVLFEGVEIGRKARIRNAILDKDVRVAGGVSIGFDPEADRARGFSVSEGGVVVVEKGKVVDA